MVRKGGRRLGEERTYIYAGGGHSRMSPLGVGGPIEEGGKGSVKNGYTKN